MPPPFDWLSKEERRGTPVVVKMENPNWSISDFSSPDGEVVVAGREFAGAQKGGRGKNAKQITWVLLLKAHRAAGCLAYLASSAVALSAAVRRRVSSGRTDSDDSSSLRLRFYSCIKIFLLASVFLLAFEIAAYFNGWHLMAPEIGFRNLAGAIYSSYLRFRAEFIAPPLQFLANTCVVLFLVQSADRFILCLGCFWIRFKRIKHVPNSMTEDDEEAGKFFPMVLIQIPMCNEREVYSQKLQFFLATFLQTSSSSTHISQVYRQSIAAVCRLDWPSSNLLIQVLDDSDDPTTQNLIREEVQKWEEAGVRILYCHRLVRHGYKAGNLKSAMNHSYVKDYEFVAIFDADFQPTPDFLKRTVPYFKVKRVFLL